MAEVTIAIQLGNSDDKLIQSEWSNFVKQVTQLIEIYPITIHFFGGCANYMPWQNVAWILVCSDYMIDDFKLKLSSIGRKYKQDSIAFSICNTEFI